MSEKFNILILRSLLGTKFVFAGHHVAPVCLPEEAKLINDDRAMLTDVWLWLCADVSEYYLGPAALP